MAIIDQNAHYEISDESYFCGGCSEIMFKYYCKLCDQFMGCYFCSFDYNQQHDCEGVN